ncbi:MAG: hypothetical protein AABX11_01630 [Nanoarchaeota archaeon]
MVTKVIQARTAEEFTKLEQAVQVLEDNYTITGDIELSVRTGVMDGITIEPSNYAFKIEEIRRKEKCTGEMIYVTPTRAGIKIGTNTYIIEYSKPKSS